MHLETPLHRCVVEMRLDGHDFDSIALTLADGAVDALVASGFRDRALDRGVERLIETLWERVAELRRPRPPIDPSTLGTASERPRVSLVCGGET